MFYPDLGNAGLFVKSAGIIPVIAGFLRENVVTVVLMDEFAKKTVESRQMSKVSPEYPVFAHVISTLRG